LIRSQNQKQIKHVSGSLGLTPADLLARGLRLPPLPDPPTLLPAGVCCAITGQAIDSGYPVSAMVTEATAEFLDCFRGGIAGWVSDSAARCFKNADPRRGNLCARSVLAFEDGTLWLPLIAREQAFAQGRPCWRDLVREVWPARAGQQLLAILSTDTKKRLWIRARVGALGHRTPLLYYDGKTAGNEVLYLDWPAFLDCLSLIEEVYEQGFPKAAIAETLYGGGKAIKAIGFAATRAYERQLLRWRERPEFKPALLIAQRTAPTTEQTVQEVTDWQPVLFP